MWRSIFALLLIPSLAWTQTDLVPQPVPSSAPSADASAPSYRTYTYFDGIRQGTSQKAVLIVFLGKDFVASPKSQTTLTPVRLELEDAIGIRVSDIEYPRPYRRRFTFQQNPVEVIGARFTVQLTLKVSGDAAPGDHRLRGKLSFQKIGDQGPSAPQHMDVEFPVRTIARGELVAPTQGPPLDIPGFDSVAQKPDRDWIWLIALAPILIPLAALEFLVCGITGQDCRC